MPLQLVWIGIKQHLATARKIFLACIVVCAIFYLFFAFAGVDRARDQVGPTPAQREEARRLRIYEEFNPKNDPVDDEETTISREMTRRFTCWLVGELCTPDPAQAHLYKENALSFKASGLIAAPLYHPPSSLYYWVRGTLENAGFVPKTYAQGIGFSALTSFQPIWKVFRNLAYLLIVIVIVVVGFMVMFRVGGGGKNAVTLESALPKLVIALLAISMSYPIAGLFVDLMYMSIALIINLLGQVAGMNGMEQNKMIAGVITGTPVDLLFTFFGGVGNSDSNYYSLAASLHSLLPGWLQRTVDTFVTSIVIGGVGSYVSATKFPGSAINPENPSPKDIFTFVGRLLVTKSTKISNILTKITPANGGVVPLGLITGLVQLGLAFVVDLLFQGFFVKVGIMFILLLGMLVIFYRMMFMLYGNYIEIILSIMTSPLALMLEAVPGQNAFVNWLKGLAVSLGVYPITIAIMLLARSIMNVTASTTPMWAPPLVTQITDQTSLQTLVAGILIYSIPNIIKAYKQKLKPAGVFDSMGMGLGVLFAGAGPIMRGTSTIMGASGLSGAMASRITKPIQQMFKLPVTQTVKMINPDNSNT